MGNTTETYSVEMRGQDAKDRCSFLVTHHSMFRISLLEEIDGPCITYRVVLWRGCDERELGSVSFQSQDEADSEFDRIVGAIEYPTRINSKYKRLL